MRAAIEHITHPDQSFRLLVLQQPAFCGVHRHPHLELTWVAQGNGVRMVGDSVEPFDDGDLVLVGPGLPHSWMATQGPAAVPVEPARGGYYALTLQFEPGLLDAAHWPELRALRPVMARARRGLAFGAGPARDRITAILAGMPAQDELGRLAAWLLLLREIAAAEGQARCLSAREAAPAARDDRLDRLLAWLHAHLGEPVRVEHAAAQIHITPAALPRFFKRETGKTLIGYLNDLRVSEACVQLRQSRRPVSVIAAACGFASAAHFDRQFKRRMGCSPRAYRGGA